MLEELLKDKKKLGIYIIILILLIILGFNYYRDGYKDLRKNDDEDIFVEQNSASDNVVDLHNQSNSTSELSEKSIPLKDKKIVTNGISKNLKKLIKKRVVIATVMEEIATEGYNAGKKMFDILYRDKSYEGNWEISKSHILFLENLEG